VPTLTGRYPAAENMSPLRVHAMNRVVKGMALAALLALPFAVDASPLTIAPHLGELAPRLAIQELASEHGVALPTTLVEKLVRVRLELRDLVFRANSKLVALAYHAGLHTPDVSVLTTEPIPSLLSLGSSSGYGWRDDPMRHSARFHSGADVRAKPGTPVVAAGDGVVVFTGYYGGYGNMIAVDHGGGVTTRYAHLRRIDTKKDAVVTGGEPIGQVGLTGRTTGPHLHFEVLLDKQPVDPVMAMTVGEIGRVSPLAGLLASLALAPEMQSGVTSTLDPPRQPRQKKAEPKPETSRPARPGYVKPVRPVS
jgi:murein DD-endopeptidase MepM/ murein hydrolase activator NlpD